MDCTERLKRIIAIHPVLLYFICYLGNPTKYKLDSRILNKQEDCKKLSYLDITKYVPSIERGHHAVLVLDCQFTYSGRKIFDELKKKKICEYIIKKCNFANRDDFNKSFRAYFSFKKDPNDLIQEKLEEIFNETYVKLAKNNYYIEKHGIKYKINYCIEGDEIKTSIELVCTCNNNTKICVDENDLLYKLKTFTPIILNCDRCGQTILISSDLHYMMKI